MPEEELRSELEVRQLPTRDTASNISQSVVASLGAGKSLRSLVSLQASCRSTITGDLNDMASEYYLMLVKVEDETAKGAFLHVSKKLLDRVLTEHNKTRL